MFSATRMTIGMATRRCCGGGRTSATSAFGMAISVPIRQTTLFQARQYVTSSSRNTRALQPTAYGKISRSRNIQIRWMSNQAGSKATTTTTTATATATATTNTTAKNTTFLQRFLGPKEIPPRGTLAWYAEMVLICTVFAITGTSTMMLVRANISLGSICGNWKETAIGCCCFFPHNFFFFSLIYIQVRPAVKNVLGLEGSFKDGPWAYRISTIVIMSPLYSILLVMVGTVFGRHAYFRFFSVKMLSRFGIPPELLDKEFHITKKTFRKW